MRLFISLFSKQIFNPANMQNKPFFQGAFIIMISMLLLSSVSVAQKLYLKAALGYSLATHKDYFNLENAYNTIDMDSVSGYSSYWIDKIPFGQGLNFELAIGSFVGKHFSAEITGFLQSSVKHSIRVDDNNDFGDFYINYYSESVLSGKIYGVKPSIVIWLLDNKVNPYFRLGGVVGYGSVTVENETRVFNTHPFYYPTENITSVFKYEGSLNFGYTAGAGIELVLGYVADFFCELNYSSIRVIPHHGKYTEYK